jgi:hypothetical protein
MTIPTFSIFSAISELFVTAGVFYIIRRNWTRRTFPLGVFLGVALFEAFINVMYMATRAAQASSSVSGGLSPAMRLFYAGHGMLSLLAYLIFVVLGVFAYQDQKENRFWFRDRPGLTWSFLVLWTISIGSGEVLFVARYLI